MINTMKNLIKAGPASTVFLLVSATLTPFPLCAQVHYPDIIPNIVASSPNYLYAGQHDEPYIHYVDIEPDTAINAGYDYGIYYKLDLNGDDTIDYQFYCRSSGGVGFGSSSSSLKGLNEHNKVITTAEHPSWIKKFDHGDSITFMDEEIASEYCIYCSEFYSEWESGSSGYWWGEDPDNYTGLIMFQGGDTIMAWVKTRAGAGSLSLAEYAWMFYPPQNNGLPDEPSCELSVYPMPARDQFSIQTCLPSQECDIFLYDLSGHLITSSRLTLVSNEPATVYMGTVRAGIYVLKAILGGKTINRKIMIMR
jgi:hypothetical protein